MDTNNVVAQKIKDTLKLVERTYPKNIEQISVTDILLQVNTETGEFVVMNDDDKVLGSSVIEQLVGERDDAAEADMIVLLRSCIEELKDFWESLSILKPFSFVLVDDEKESLTDLYLVDDDTMIVGDELLKGLDEELDDFINNLMKE